MMRVDAGGRNITGLYVLHDGTNTVSLTGKEWAALHDDLIALLAAVETRATAAERMCADYTGMVNEVADIASRIGPAAMPEWIRGKLDEIVSRHRRWNAALATPADAGEGQ
jgi:hypothetical protein